MLLSRFNLWKTFAKINSVTGIFQGFYLILSNFLLYTIFPEIFSMVNSLNFKFSVTKQPFSYLDLT